MVVVLPSITPAGTTIRQWVDPTGTVRSLSGTTSAVNVEVGERGLGLPSVTLIADKLPFESGDIARHAAVSGRDIELPLHFSAASETAMEALMDSVYGWFATATEQARTPGYYRITRADGSVRQIAAYYVSGLEGDLSSERAGVDWQDATVLLRAPNPWATATADTFVGFSEADFGVSNPQFVTIDGDMDAYPVWVLWGPGEDWNIANYTTLALFELSADGGLTVPAGQFAVVDTRPQNVRTGFQVFDQAGASQFSKLTATSKLWHFAPGVNQITISATGTTGASSVQLRYLPRYRSLMR